ncbi:AraC family transcriptional regulator [Paenibacillus albiflavus]|uniref:AraC family transcriptional regulator n=1 Tax=Paenibacillus albiflavus TaxID=2545760 RepID=A0A4V2WNJ5_9BACL|nr:AraC family transcriptional regulator [Paenibacillus albiflavus]TCZ75682.1 AraC family transcriptional regulator [Paenibacillus albiflavus]
MHTVEIVQRAIDYIEEHLEESIELERVAEAAAMSVPNFYRMFYAMTGYPIKEYIRKRRISEAAYLLRHTELQTIDIGFRCGYGSISGVLEWIYRWLATSPDYEADRERSWYAHYIPPDAGVDRGGLAETDVEWSVTVMCCVPINLRKQNWRIDYEPNTNK